MLICILGKSASGKTTFLKRILKSKSFNVETLPSYTTRPKRNENETDYIFLTQEDFESKKESFLDVVEYNVATGEIWSYATVSRDDLEKDKTYLLVTSPQAFQQIRENYDGEVISIYIDVPDRLRFYRSVRRESNPNILEILRRIIADNIDFKDMYLEADYIINNEDDNFDRTLNKIKTAIRLELGLYDN